MTEEIYEQFEEIYKFIDSAIMHPEFDEFLNLPVATKVLTPTTPSHKPQTPMSLELDFRKRRSSILKPKT